MKVARLDHLVLTVNSIEVTSQFYSNVLGMDIVTFGEGRVALTFGEQIKTRKESEGRGEKIEKET